MAVAHEAVFDGYACIDARFWDGLNEVRRAIAEVWIGTTSSTDNRVSNRTVFLAPGDTLHAAWKIETFAGTGYLDAEYPLKFGIYVYEDNVDGDGGAAANHVAFHKLVDLSDVAFPTTITGDTSVTGALNLGITKPGTYKVVPVLYHVNHTNPPKRTDPSDGTNDAQEYYFDADGYAAFTNGATTNATFNELYVNGLHQSVCRLRTYTSVQNFADDATGYKRGYTQSPAVSGKLHSGAVSSRSQGVWVGVSKTGSAHYEKERAVIDYIVNSTDGAFTTTTYDVNTVFPEDDGAGGGVDHRLRLLLGPDGGELTTPVSQSSDLCSQTGIRYRLYQNGDTAWTVLAKPTLRAFNEDATANARHLTFTDDEGTGEYDRTGHETVAAIDHRAGAGVHIWGGQKFERTDSAFNLNGDLSITFIGKFVAGGNQHFFDITDGSNIIFRLTHMDDDSLRLLYTESGGTDRTVSSATGLLTAGVHRIFVRRDYTNSTLKAWVDGTLVIDTTTTAAVSVTTPTIAIGTGRGGTIYQHEGSSHEVRVWGSAIPQATGLAITDPNDLTYRKTLEGSEVACYFLEDYATSIATDPTPAGYVALTPHCVEKQDYGLKEDGVTTATSLSIGHKVSVSDFTATSTPGTGVYNRQETYSAKCKFKDVHGRYITPQNTALRIADDTGTIEYTQADQNANPNGEYLLSYTITSTAKATWDTTGSARHLNVVFKHFSLRNPTFDYTNTVTHKVSRKWLVKQASGAAEGTVYTGKTATPTSDEKTTFNRSQTAYYAGIVYNVRGEALTNRTIYRGVRYPASETYEAILSSQKSGSGGEFSGSVSFSTSATVAGRTVVVATTFDETLQPRTGTGGSGNFAETSTTTPEFTVTDQLQVTSHTEKDVTRSATVDTNFTIGEDVVYGWGEVKDAHGDPISDATVKMEQISPQGLIRQTESGTTDAQGWVGPKGFDSRPPKGSGWVQRCTVENWNGNTGTDDQALSMLSAFTANKNPIVLLGPVASVANVDTTIPTASEGDIAVPGDRILIGFAYLVDGKRTAPDTSPTPRFMLASFNQSTSKAEVLQADGTWKDKDATGYEEKYWEFPVGIEPATANGTDYLEYVCNFGTAAQGVTTSNGYVLDTSNWPKRQIVVTVDFHYESQGFNDDERFLFGQINDTRIRWTTDGDANTAPVTSSHRHITGTDVDDKLTIDQYKRTTTESLRNFSSGTGYVRDGTSLVVTGVKKESTTDKLRIIYNGTTYTEGTSTEIVMGTTSNGVTPYTATLPVGTETTSTGRTFRAEQDGQIAKEVTIVVDQTVPAAPSVTISGTAGANGWYTSDVTLTADGSDAISGVSHYQYRYSTDGGVSFTSWLTNKYPKMTMEDSDIVVEQRVVDKAGNNSTAASTSLKIDKTAPSTSISLSGTAGSNNWYTSNVGVSLSATDATSGVAKTEYRTSTDGGATWSAWTTYSATVTLSTEGSTLFSFRSVDTAGLVENLSTNTVKIDKSGPLINTWAHGLMSDGVTTQRGATSTTGVRRGEYLRFNYDFSDAISGIDTASIVVEDRSSDGLAAEDWLGALSISTKSGTTGWIRTTSTAPTTAVSRILRVKVKNMAGLETTADLTVHFEAPNAIPTVSLPAAGSVDWTNDRPNHLNSSDYTITSYDDNTIGVKVSWSPAIAKCRNSGTNDSIVSLADGTLNIAGGSATPADGTTSRTFSNHLVMSQTEGVGLTVKGDVTDQYYQSGTATAGDFAYNPNRSRDQNNDDDVGGTVTPFTKHAYNSLTDEVDVDTGSYVNASVIGGRIKWSAATGSVDVKVALTNNTNELFQVRLGDTSSTEIDYTQHGANLEVQYKDGNGTWKTISGDTFGVDSSFSDATLNSAAAIWIRVKRLTSSGPEVGVVAVNHQ